MKKIFAAIVVSIEIFSSISASFASENPFSVKSGIYYSDQWGLYLANIIEKDGSIFNIIIDRVANGKSSKELHDNYGIKNVSSLGKDWWEQVAFYENWIVEHGVEAVETDDKGHALNTDLISGATINVEELSLAVKNALIGKAEMGDYVMETGISYDEIWGLHVANVILKNGEIVKVLIDRISNDGQDIKEQYDGYGMKPLSSINKDWWEQVAYYEDWVLEHGIDAVKYGADKKAENADLISGATLEIDEMTRAVLDAVNKLTIQNFSR